MIMKQDRSRLKQIIVQAFTCAAVLIAASTMMTQAVDVFEAIKDANCREWFQTRTESATKFTGIKAPVLREDKKEICFAAMTGLTAPASLALDKFWVCYNTEKCAQFGSIRIPLPCDVQKQLADLTKASKSQDNSAVELWERCIRRRDNALALIRAACPDTSKVIQALDECRKKANEASDRAAYDHCPDKAINENGHLLKDLPNKKSCLKKHLEVTRCFAIDVPPNLEMKPGQPGELPAGRCATKGAWRRGCTGSMGRLEMLAKTGEMKLKQEDSCPEYMLKEPTE